MDKLENVNATKLGTNASNVKKKEEEDEGIPDNNDDNDSYDVGEGVHKNENVHIVDEDLREEQYKKVHDLLREDQYEKAHDLLCSMEKKTYTNLDLGNFKYDLNDFDDNRLARHIKQKDVQFPSFDSLQLGYS